MIKKVMAFILSACILLSMPAPAFAAGGVSVFIDGSNIAFNNSTGSPFIDSGNRTLVPLRITMEAYGCEVFWDNENNKAIVYKDGITVVCPIGEKYIIVNGQTIAIDTAAVVVRGRTYLPIRCVLEAVGATVGWNGAAKTVDVTRGKTDALLHQDEYLSRALKAIDSNKSLSAQYSADAKRAVTKYLQNIPVDEAQIAKMCARLELVKFREGTLEQEMAGYCSSQDNIHYTITLDTVTEGKIKDEAAYDSVVFHELCHLFSNMETTAKWFQEGMTTMLEMDIAERDVMLHLTIYDAYYRIICILAELIGRDTLLQAYLTGDENILYKQLNQYAGVTNSKAILNANAEQITNALIGGVFTWMGKGGGKTKEQWKTEYSDAAQELSELFEKAYFGKYGSDISGNPLLSAYLSWLKYYSFLGTAMIMANPTLSASSDVNYYGLKDRRRFTIIEDKTGAFCHDGELVYYH